MRQLLKQSKVGRTAWLRACSASELRAWAGKVAYFVGKVLDFVGKVIHLVGEGLGFWL